MQANDTIARAIFSGFLNLMRLMSIVLVLVNFLVRYWGIEIVGSCRLRFSGRAVASGPGHFVESKVNTEVATELEIPLRTAIALTVVVAIILIGSV